MAASSSKSGKLSAGKNANHDIETSVLAGGVLLPLIKSKDTAKLLPTIATALQRSADDLLPAEDLDTVQVELETLLSSAALRYRVLKCEYESLDKDEKRRNKHASVATAAAAGDKPASPAAAVVAAAAASSGKRKRDDIIAVRKPKGTPSSSLKHSKNSKNSPAGLQTDDGVEFAVPGVVRGSAGSAGDHHQKMAMPKNDIPNKFWLSVEPYCMPLTNEDLRLLDDLLDQYSGPLVPPIPELGPHYSSVWASEDLKEVQQGSNMHSNRLKQQNNAAVNNMMKKADALVDSCVTGPLTQRLVSALMEEQFIGNPAEAVTAENSNSSSENATLPNNFRSLSMLKNCIDIEKRVKKELIEQGILDLADFPHNDEDEILSEIKRVIAELSSVADYNGAALKRLRQAASEEMKRLEIKRKLDTIDQEILETYKRTLQNKAKRKPMSNEDQQEIFRLTHEQKTLSDLLERSQSNNYLYE